MYDLTKIQRRICAHAHTHTTHTHEYMYTYICVCLYMCGWVSGCVGVGVDPFKYFITKSKHD